MDIKVPQLLKTKILVLLIMLFSILIRIPYFDCPLCPDESGFAYQAYFWLNDVNPYRSSFFIYFPGFPLLYAFIFKTLGINPLNIRLFLAFWNAITVLFIYLTAKKLFSEKIALLSSFYYACFSWLPLIKGYMGKEIFMLLPLSLSLYFYFLYRDCFHKLPLFLAAFFAGLAVVFKQSALPPWGCFLIFIYLESPNKFKHIFIFLLGASLPIIASATYGCISLGIKSFFYNIIFCPAGTFSIFSGYWWYHFLRFLYSLNKTGIIFWLIALILGQKFIKREFAWYFLISYLLFSFLGVALGGHWFDHYYAQLLPSLCILLGWTSVKIWQFKRKTYISINLILLIFPFFIYILVSLHYHRLCNFSNGWDLSQKIASYLYKNSDKTDKIYAFLYNDPTIYFLAKRKSAFPYLFRHEILYFPENIMQFMEFIRSDKAPKYLIAYSEEKSLKFAIRYCKIPKGFINKIKKCFSVNFRPFCKNYPVQIFLIKKVFKLIPKYYSPVKIIFANGSSVVIWKRKQKQNS